MQHTRLNFELANNISAYRICALSNETLVTTNGNSISFYNKNFQLIKKIDKFDQQTSLSTYFVTSNKANRLYFSNTRSHQLIMLDCNCDQLIKIVGSYGSNPNQFNEPVGLCYHQNSLYVCDHLNKRIQKLNEELEHLTIFKLDFKPWDIRAINDVAVISNRLDRNKDNIVTVQNQQYYDPYNQNIKHKPECESLLIYQLKTFQLIMKYDGNARSTIGDISGYFYEYNNNSYSFIFYNEKFEPINKIRTDSLKFPLQKPNHVWYEDQLEWFQNKLLILFNGTLYYDKTFV